MILSEQHFIEKNSSKIWRERFQYGVTWLRQKIASWQHRERERALIAQMSERDFKDFGMTRGQMQFQLESPLARKQGVSVKKNFTE